MTEDEAAAYLGWETTRLAHRRRRGAGSGDPGYTPRWFRMGGRVRYLKSELDAWLEANEQYVRDASEFLTNEQLAEHLGITTTMLRDMRGRLARDPASDTCPPWVKQGVRLLYKVDEVDAWLQRQVEGGGPPPDPRPRKAEAHESRSEPMRKAARKATRTRSVKKTGKRRVS